MSTCKCRYLGNTHLQAGDEVHTYNKQGFAVHEGIRPIVLWWQNDYDINTGDRTWTFKGAEAASQYVKHRSSRPLHIDFKRPAYNNHD